MRLSLPALALVAFLAPACKDSEKNAPFVAPADTASSEDPGAAADVAAPGDVSSEDVSSEELPASPDASAEDVAPDVGPDVEDAALDTGVEPDAGTDAGPPPPAGCCDAPADCAEGSVCVAAAEGFGWCLPAGTDDACWTDADCENAVTTCHLSGSAPTCGAEGAAAPTAGHCLIDTLCTSACEDSDSCDGLMCQDGFCLPDAGPGGCWNSDFCDIGLPCEGVVMPTGACLAPGDTMMAKPGKCLVGKGETCVTLGLGDFGDCETELGWALFSGKVGCQVVHGCDCGAFCDQIFPTQAECAVTCMPQPCCADDAACPEGAKCAEGNCVPAAPEGMCWTDEECGAGSFCTSTIKCKCGPVKCAKSACKKGVPCVQPKNATPGNCYPIPACCGSDGDCPAGAFCNEGTCVPLADAGHCWTDAACPAGTHCSGASVPSCEGEEIPAPGVCLPVGVSCCAYDFACTGQCLSGYCQTPAPGQCWSQYDCGVGYTCEGVVAPTTTCLAGQAPNGTPGTCTPVGDGGLCLAYGGATFKYCDANVSLGWMWTGNGCIEVSACSCEPFCDQLFATEAECVNACAPPVCCSADGDCPSGAACTKGHCLAMPTTGGCYADSQCGEGMECLYAYMCQCGTTECLLGCKVPPCPAQPIAGEGVCAPKPLCCTTDEDCPGGQICLTWMGAEARCAPAPSEGQCYQASACAAGQTCEAYSACSCSDPWCVTSPGTCTAAPEGCCDDDVDCGVGFVCTKDAVGFGPVNGTCEALPDAAACYSTAHCQEGEVCINAWAPTCGDTSSVPSPGQCVPQ